MAVVDINVRVLSIKTYLFYTILLFDLILNSFVELSFGKNLQGTNNIYQVYVIFIAQVATQAVIILWFLFMFWHTFLLRFGLIGILIKQFRWTFILLSLHVLITFAERVFRFSYELLNKDTVDTSIWDRSGYRVVYYLRFISLILFYPLMLNFAYRINLPEYYKPTKWMK